MPICFQIFNYHDRSQPSIFFSNPATKAFALTITDAADVEGVPSSAKGMWAAAYAAHANAEDAESKAEPDAENGPWRVTLDGPSYIAAMSHIPNRNLRKSVYLGYLTRASELNGDDADGKNNIPLIYEILELKTEMAKMLGYDNYADLSLARKMAPSVAAVQELSDLILAKSLPAAIAELDEITALARSTGGEEYSLSSIPCWMACLACSDASLISTSAGPTAAPRSGTMM